MYAPKVITMHTKHYRFLEMNKIGGEVSVNLLTPFVLTRESFLTKRLTNIHCSFSFIFISFNNQSLPIREEKRESEVVCKMFKIQGLLGHFTSAFHQHFSLVFFCGFEPTMKTAAIAQPSRHRVGRGIRNQASSSFVPGYHQFFQNRRHVFVQTTLSSLKNRQTSFSFLSLADEALNSLGPLFWMSFLFLLLELLFLLQEEGGKNLNTLFNV